MRADHGGFNGAETTGRVLAETAAARVFSIVAVGTTERLSGRGVLHAFNATTHRLNGEHEPAADSANPCRTTGVRLLTHLAATGVQATVFELWLRSGGRMRREAVGEAAATALVDRRATPGWKSVPTTTAMVAVYLALSTGFAVAAGPARASTARPDGELRHAL